MALPDSLPDTLELSEVQPSIENPRVNGDTPKIGDVRTAPVPLESVVTTEEIDNPYQQRVTGFLDAEVARGVGVVSMGRVARKILGQKKLPPEEFRKLIDAVNNDPRLRYKEKGLYVVKEAKSGDGHERQAAIKDRDIVEQLGIDGLANAVGRRMHASRRSVGESVFMGIAASIAQRWLSEDEKSRFIEAMISHPRVILQEDGRFMITAPTLEEQLPEEPAPVNGHRSFDSMLKAWRKESPKPAKKPRSRRRVHYKTTNDLNGYSPDLPE